MPVYILAAARTPLGAFGGCLRDVSPTDLAAHALRETLRRGRVAPDGIAEVILGSIHTGLQGGNPALLAARDADLPFQVPAWTLGGGAASGLKAVALAALGLQQGRGVFAMAGGTESASQAPFLVPGARWGMRFGETDLLDSLLIGGFTPARGEETLSLPGPCLDCDLTAWAERSRRKALDSVGRLTREIAPLSVRHRKESRVIREDEPPEAFPVAPPWAGHSAFADGAAALLLASTLPTESPEPLARILDWVEVGPDSAKAVRGLLGRIGLAPQQIDCWEIHEASAAHLLALLTELPEIDPVRVNPHGGALALGDPPGASGARLASSLAFTLQVGRLQTGIALVPAIDGPGIAMAISRS